MNIQRPDFCTTVGIEEYDWEKNWNDTFVLANKYHKKMHEECPPPYAAVDAGKVHGLLTAIQSLQAENAELREALKPFAHPDFHKLFASNVSGDESIVYVKNNAELKIKHFRKAAELVNGDTQ